MYCFWCFVLVSEWNINHLFVGYGEMKVVHVLFLRCCASFGMKYHHFFVWHGEMIMVHVLVLRFCASFGMKYQAFFGCWQTICLVWYRDLAFGCNTNKKRLKAFPRPILHLVQTIIMSHCFSFLCRRRTDTVLLLVANHWQLPTSAPRPCIRG